MTDAEAGSIGKLLAEVSAEIAAMRKAHDADIANAVAAERAAVVAWLRFAYLRGAADAIERGDHRKEEP